ncbi:MAG: hypothetical protein R6U35_05095 [Candidatus Humimicrobiaceae bacterium]
MTFWHARNEKPYPGGITAVYSTSLTREGIFQGLENGRIYASSDYGRPCLDITIIRIGVRDGSPRTLEIVFVQDGAYTPKIPRLPLTAPNGT